MKVTNILAVQATEPSTLPTADVAVAAGFPSPAQDYTQVQIDLNEVLIKDATNTYILTVTGDSMEGAGIYDGDDIIVDHSLVARDGSVVVASIDGEFTVKRLRIGRGNQGWLVAENPKYAPIPIPAESEFLVFGVVTRCLHKLI
ncbi:translesion error-prone DNA polymerase V autoproteolytic subunit [Microbacterium foliorum]|uniref:LexA family protein n=1 Tax=Rothia terrae TaxID=396015 RepID=UPI0034120536